MGENKVGTQGRKEKWGHIKKERQEHKTVRKEGYKRKEGQRKKVRIPNFSRQDRTLLFQYLPFLYSISIFLFLYFLYIFIYFIQIKVNKNKRSEN